MLIRGLLFISRYLCYLKSSLLYFVYLICDFYKYLYYIVGFLVNLFRTNSKRDIFLLFKSVLVVNKKYFIFTTFCLVVFIIFSPPILAFFFNLLLEFCLFIIVLIISTALFNYINNN